MARGVFSGVNHFLYTGGLITAVPLSMFAWVYPTAVTAENAILAVTYTAGAAAAEDGWIVKINITTGLAQATAADGTAANSSTTAAGVNVNAWNHVGGVFTSATLRNAYLNGTIASNSTTSRTPSATVDKAAIGVKYLQNNAKSTSATLNYIAHAAFWNAALTQAEVTALSKGFSPLLIRPQSLVEYYPLTRGDGSGDELGLKNASLKMIEQGAVAIQTNPPIFQNN